MRAEGMVRVGGRDNEGGGETSREDEFSTCLRTRISPPPPEGGSYKQIAQPCPGGTNSSSCDARTSLGPWNT
ncbi:hypothetical protein RRG08_030038 [Elysia crispata]|uniref:Uncharacterized protein n=1 Tax=Elysia crispata TaxID=231223 RepID=A0AAE1CPK1_9GAST|nr:hypothetical protein RRG08_030038 [Elysia crispata]